MHVHYMVMNGRRLILNNKKKTAKAISISYKKFENILRNEGGITKVSAQWMLHLPTPYHKVTGLITIRKNLTLFQADLPGVHECFLT